MAAYRRSRLFIIFFAITTAPVRVNKSSSIPIALAKVQAKLSIRFIRFFAPAIGEVRVSGRVTLVVVVAKAPPCLVVCIAPMKRPIAVTTPAEFLILAVSKARPPLVDRFAIARIPVTMSAEFPILVVGKTRRPRVLTALLMGPIGIVVPGTHLSFVVSKPLRPPLLGIAIAGMQIPVMRIRFAVLTVRRSFVVSTARPLLLCFVIAVVPIRFAVPATRPILVVSKAQWPLILGFVIATLPIRVALIELPTFALT